ncbi:MAG: DUF3987 domain-containing protein [Anaerolineae bacterium]
MIQRYWQHTSSLLDRPFPLAKTDVENELFPRPLVLSQQAKAYWVQFHDELDQALKPDGMYRCISRTANKAAEQALRIAGVLSIIDDFDAECISMETMQRAVELARFYLDEALRLRDMQFLDPDLTLSQSVLNWMKKKAAQLGKEKIFSLKDIYQKAGPRSVRNKRTAQKVMSILEEHGMIVRSAPERLEWQLNCE